MLTIKDKGLLYRFLAFNGATGALDSGRATLCGTFWLTMFHLVKDIGISVLLAAISAIPSIWITKELGWLSQGFIWTSPWWTTPVLMITGLVMWAAVIGAFVGVVWGISKLWEKTKGWRNSRKFASALKEELARDEELTWSNIWQKVKIAKKDKLCPLVKVEYVE